MNLPKNPYVGPRTFEEKDRRFFFGRKSEARDLAARIISERLLLFYAQSGVGKSSLINTRIIPRLRDEERFYVLPVGRVSGELPQGVQSANNIYTFNLMNSLDESGEDPNRLAEVHLSDFLARLGRKIELNKDGKRVPRWIYRPDIMPEKKSGSAKRSPSSPRFVLFIDQFEEIITNHPDRWIDRETFFAQLNQALADDANLWVVLAMREDFVAALNPYAPLLFNRLRARFYMERMGEESAVQAIREPAKLGGRPFAPGVAETLVKDLRQVRVPGRKETITGQYVEPLQLQVVCFRLWKQLNVQYSPSSSAGDQAQGSEKKETIEASDLVEAGNVDQALAEFYVETLVGVLDEEKVQDTGISEYTLRAWFNEQLITETGIRNALFRDEETGLTGRMANVVVDALANRFLLRRELRGGGYLVELMHDRFVDPILQSNRDWFIDHARPQIERFEVVPRVLTQGMNVSIEWSVNNADTVMLQPGDQPLDGYEPPLSLQPDQTQHYRLFAQRAGSEPVPSQTHTVSVLPDRISRERIRDALSSDRFSFVIGPEFDRALFSNYETELFPGWESWGVNDTSVRIYFGTRYERLVSEAESYPGMEQFRQMAGIDCPVYITASFHPFMEAALRMAGKQPRSDTYRGIVGEPYDSLFSYPDPFFVPTFAEPLVFHLFGIDTFPESLLLTEYDYFSYLISVSEDRDRIPLHVRFALANYFKVIVGFDIADLSFKTFWHGVDIENRVRSLGGLVQVLARSKTGEDDVSHEESYLARHKYETVWGSSSDLISLLYEIAKGEEA